MRTVQMQMAETPADLGGLPVGSRILTSHGKVYEQDQIEDPQHPEPFPKKTGFGPEDAEDQKQWRRDKAKWEKENRRADAGHRYWIEPGTLQPFPLDGLQHWLPALILPPKS